MSQDTTHMIERPPVVVVMGHVDHGKSTLLDFIRKSNIVAKEAGGITQHVAAYEVEHVREGSKKRITFIDTPGHAAFSTIRARGANVADIAILVVAADDGVKAQTLEALASIRESKIPFIVAINKIDKANANIDRTQASLLEHQVYLEKFGGDVPWVAISAKAGTGVAELLDLILIVAELQELKADATVAAEGFIIEAHRDQKRGIAATLILSSGTLKSGMAVVAGGAIAPVRIMENHAGKVITEATFSTPVTLIGFDQLPEVGETFHTFKNKKEAEAARELEGRVSKKSTGQTMVAEQKNADGTRRFMLPVIVRADTTGSLEAIMQESHKIGDEHAGVQIIQSGIGNVSENDVKAIMASGDSPAVLVGFNVHVDSIAETLGRQHNVKIELFNIIYKLTEYLEECMKIMAPKRVVVETLGKARIIRQFSSQQGEHVVGGAVTEGYLARRGTVRVLRRKAEVGIGKIKNIQANKQNVERIEIDREFGAQIEANFEIAEGDILEYFTSVEK